MQRLWSPWRMEYVGKSCPQQRGCLFCGIAANPEDPEARVIWRTGRAMVIMNKYPYSNGHIMIVPKRHLANVMDLSPEERLEMMDLLALGEQALKQALSAHGINAGFNLGQAAGAGIPGHLHLHLVPRWQNDVNFMTALADVRIIPEHLDATYRKLKAQFARMGAGGAAQ